MSDFPGSVIMIKKETTANSGSEFVRSNFLMCQFENRSSMSPKMLTVCRRIVRATYRELVDGFWDLGLDGDVVFLPISVNPLFHSESLPVSFIDFHEGDFSTLIAIHLSPCKQYWHATICDHAEVADMINDCWHVPKSNCLIHEVEQGFVTLYANSHSEVIMSNRDELSVGLSRTAPRAMWDYYFTLEESKKADRRKYSDLFESQHSGLIEASKSRHVPSVPIKDSNFYKKTALSQFKKLDARVNGAAKTPRVQNAKSINQFLKRTAEGKYGSVFKENDLIDTINARTDGVFFPKKSSYFDVTSLIAGAKEKILGQNVEPEIHQEVDSERGLSDKVIPNLRHLNERLRQNFAYINAGMENPSIDKLRFEMGLVINGSEANAEPVEKEQDGNEMYLEIIASLTKCIDALENKPDAIKAKAISETLDGMLRDWKSFGPSSVKEASVVASVEIAEKIMSTKARAETELKKYRDKVAADAAESAKQIKLALEKAIDVPVIRSQKPAQKPVQSGKDKDKKEAWINEMVSKYPNQPREKWVLLANKDAPQVDVAPKEAESKKDAWIDEMVSKYPNHPRSHWEKISENQ